MRNRAAVDVNFERFARVLPIHAQLKSEVALGIRLSFGNQGRRFGLHLIVAKQSQRLPWVGHGQRRDVLLVAMPVNPNNDIR